MRLNPAKCTFEVKARKFLGHMVTERGIEVNPLKVRAIQEMSSPRALKEAQALTGRIVALSRFESRLAERGLPFFRVLRKSGMFQWTAECQVAFKQLKEFLATLPLLKQPEMGYPVIVYLVVGDESISSVLVREDRKEQCPVYFVSNVLHGAKVVTPYV